MANGLFLSMSIFQVEGDGKLSVVQVLSQVTTHFLINWCKHYVIYCCTTCLVSVLSTSSTAYLCSLMYMEDLQ